MNGGFSLEGGIEIGLAVKSDRIVEVSIDNRRPLGLSTRLEGLEPQAALNRVTTLYSVCRIAQGLAGCMAVERALRIDPGPQHKTARAFLLRGETVLDHATTALLHWPALLGQKPAGLPFLKCLRASFAELWRSVYPDGDWMRPGGGRLAPDKMALEARLAAAEYALEEAGLALPLDLRRWRIWTGIAKGPAADLLRLLDTEALAGYGASKVGLLDRIKVPELERRLASDTDGEFIARPDWEGAAQETGPLARRQAEPVIQEAVAVHGCGLAARFLAQSVETVRCLEEMRNLAADLSNCDGSQAAAGDGEGAGLVEAARGWLAHRVQISGGLIRRYQILAPTEWNFHPNGPLAQGLLDAWDPDPERLARLMVVALDPCVPWRLQMR